jgi:hypothetical protein
MSIVPAFAAEPIPEATDQTNQIVIVDEPLDEATDVQPEKSTGAVPIVPLIIIMLVGGAIAGWFIRGQMDKRKASASYQSDDDDYDQDEYDDYSRDEVAHGTVLAKQPPRRPTIMSEDDFDPLEAADVRPSRPSPRVNTEEPAGYDDLKRPYYYDTQGQPFYNDPETGNPIYYYPQK